MHPDPALGALWYVAFLLSITCHEAAHALASHVGGDDTAFEEGQVTLSPVPHIRREPFGTVLVPILTYFMNGWMLGWANAPFDRYWADRYPRRAAWMALAGPLANLVLAIIAGVAIKAGLSTGFFFFPDSQSISQIVAGADGLPLACATFASILFLLNVILFAFNLMPLPPLDGISVISLVLPEETARDLRRMVSSPGLSIVGILIAWELFPRMFPPVLHFALGLLY